MVMTLAIGIVILILIWLTHLSVQNKIIQEENEKIKRRQGYLRHIIKQLKNGRRERQTERTPGTPRTSTSPGKTRET